jgi:integrating conjugative element protein (TIGR03758 family)
MKMVLRWIALVFFSTLSLESGAAGTYDDYLVALRAFESGNRPSIVNPFGYAGWYQMGETAMIDAGYYRRDGTPNTNDWNPGSFTGKNGINSLADFLSSPAKQTQAITDYNQKQWSYITAMRLDQAIGRTINGILITESGLLAGAHLVGIGGLQQFINSNGRIVPKDGNNTPITQYIRNFGGFALGPVAPGFVPPGGAPPVFVPPVGGPSTTIPVPIASIPIPPGTAFLGASGRSPADVKLALGMLITTFLFLWVVWTSLSHFDRWRKGALETMSFQSDMVRALVVMMVIIVMVQ